MSANSPTTLGWSLTKRSDTLRGLSGHGAPTEFPTVIVVASAVGRAESTAVITGSIGETESRRP